MSTIKELIQESRVLDLGPLPAPRLAPNVTVHQALQFLGRGRRGALVAVDGLRPVGIFTERDLVYRLPEGLLTSKDARKRNLKRLTINEFVRVFGHYGVRGGAACSRRLIPPTKR